MTGAARLKPEPKLVIDAARLAASIGSFAVFSSVNGHAQSIVTVGDPAAPPRRKPETGSAR